MRTMDGSSVRNEPLLPKASLDTCLKRGIFRSDGSAPQQGRAGDVFDWVPAVWEY